MTPLFKHKNNTDVAIEVIKMRYIPETAVFKIKVLWWNIGLCHAPWPMGLSQNIIVSKDKWRDWERYRWHPTK